MLLKAKMQVYSRNFKPFVSTSRLSSNLFTAIAAAVCQKLCFQAARAMSLDRKNKSGAG